MKVNFLTIMILWRAFCTIAGSLGQVLYQPPDVAGWQRDEDWVNTSTLTGRWQLFEIYLATLFYNGEEETFRDLAINLTNNSNDPAFITQVIVDYFNSKELFTTSDYAAATDIFKWTIPQNYYDDGLWNLGWSEAPFQVYLLLVYLSKMPEFQLK